MKIAIFFTIFTILFLVQTISIKLYLINRLSLTKKVKNYLSLALYFIFFCACLYPLTRYYPEVPNWVYFILSLPIGIIFLSFIFSIIYSIFYKAYKRVKFKENRRDFFKKSFDTAVVSALVFSNAKAINNVYNIDLESVDIKLPNLKKAYKIVQLSDIHIGGLITKEFVQNLVQRVNTLNPDIVVITGDLVDIKLEYAKEALEELRNFKTLYGVYFIVGNHEYYHNIASIILYVSSLGIKVLENENVYIGEEDSGFNLAGVYDIQGQRFNYYKPDLKKAIKDTKENYPTVLLAHQPKFVEQIGDFKIDLVLSGHTHGGQIFPFNFLVRLQQPYIKGLHQHNNATQIYVNKGTGYWGPPMRLGASSEITLINLS